MQEMTSQTATSAEVDKVEVVLRGIAQNIIAVVFGLLPLFFIPISFAPLGYTKTFLVIVGVFVALIFYGLSVLRSGKLTLAAPVALLGLWAVAATAAISAVLSGEDSLSISASPQMTYVGAVFRLSRGRRHRVH